MNNPPLNRRVLIVGEGRETEYNYFVGFRNAFEAELKATATSMHVKRGKGGDGRLFLALGRDDDTQHERYFGGFRDLRNRGTVITLSQSNQPAACSFLRQSMR